MPNRKLRLKLKQDRLVYQRYGKDGRLTGKRQVWRIRKDSYAPRALFHLVLGYVRQRVNQCEDKSFEAVRKAALRGLCEAARACGCKPSFGAEGGDALWTLRGEPFFAFQIHKDFLRKETATKLRKGKAWLRWVVIVKKSGYVEFVPRRTRRVSEETNSQ